MQTGFRWGILALLTCGIASRPALAQVDCAILDPRDSVSQSQTGKITASVDTLYKIAKAGGSIEGKTKKEIQNLQRGAPITEQGLVKLRTLYLFCDMVANAKDISTERKVQLYNVMMNIKEEKKVPKKPPTQKPMAGQQQGAKIPRGPIPQEAPEVPRPETKVPPQPASVRQTNRPEDQSGKCSSYKELRAACKDTDVGGAFATILITPCDLVSIRKIHISDASGNDFDIDRNSTTFKVPSGKNNMSSKVEISYTNLSDDKVRVKSIVVNRFGQCVY